VVAVAPVLELERGPRLDPDPLELVAPQVELDVPEVVDVQDAGPDPLGTDLGHGDVEPHQLRRIDGGPELRRWNAVRDVGRGRGADVPAVERFRDRVERV